MRHALLSASLIALTSVFAAAPALAQDGKAAKPAAAKPVATVNGKAIPANRAEIRLANLLAQGQANSPELQAAIREELVRLEVLAQEAVKKGVEKKAEVKGQLEFARQQVLIGAYLNEFALGLKIADADVQKEYDNIKAALGEKEYKARHILVESEGEAKDIIAKLKQGGKFNELAKTSKDPGSKERGGELPWANKADNYVPEFWNGMTALEKGKYTEAPVQSQFGWHVIQLDDVRELKAPAFDEVKPQIIQRMRQQAVEKHVLELRNKAKVE